MFSDTEPDEENRVGSWTAVDAVRCVPNIQFFLLFSIFTRCRLVWYCVAVQEMSSGLNVQSANAGDVRIRLKKNKNEMYLIHAHTLDMFLSRSILKQNK